MNSDWVKGISLGQSFGVCERKRITFATVDVTYSDLGYDEPRETEMKAGDSILAGLSLGAGLTTESGRIAETVYVGATGALIDEHKCLEGAGPFAELHVEVRWLHDAPEVAVSPRGGVWWFGQSCPAN